MDKDNVIPFPKRPPSEGEMEAYRQSTRNWDASLRLLLFPEHFRHEREKNPPSE